MRSRVKGGCVIGVYFPVSTVVQCICPATQTLRKGTRPYDNVKDKLSNAQALSNTPTDVRVLKLRNVKYKQRKSYLSTLHNFMQIFSSELVVTREFKVVRLELLFLESN